MRVKRLASELSSAREIVLMPSVFSTVQSFPGSGVARWGPVLLGGSGDGEAAVAAWSVRREPVAGTPEEEAAPIPPKKARGTEITSAQGQDTTRKVQAR